MDEVKPDSNQNADEEIVKIALSRGLFFGSAEIFSSIQAGFWDYGPIGLKILNNIINQWRRTLNLIGAVEISGSVILPRKVLQASGHEAGFFDIVVVCSKCRSIYRVDKLLEEKNPGRSYEALPNEEYLKLLKENKIKCEKCGGELAEIRRAGTMFPLKVGFDQEESINAYLRPEACQSIFLDFKRLFSLYGKKLPFSIAQVGKAFRNEVSPRNSLLRQREFTQQDIEIFFLDDDFTPIEDLSAAFYDSKENSTKEMKISEALSSGFITTKVAAYSISIVQSFLLNLGFNTKVIRYRKLYEDKAFYSKESFDVEIKKGDQWTELMSCNERGDYDLGAYEKAGADIPKVDGKIPKIFEISAGTDRIFYLLLYNSFVKDGEREFFALNGRVSPYKAAIFPLVSKDNLDVLAFSVFSRSMNKDDIYYLDKGSIGKRYRKADEIGIPISITLDYQTLDDNTATFRDRDSMEQFRAKLSDVDKIILDLQSRPFPALKETYAV